MLRHFLPALAWAAVLAIATWPLRAELARRGMGETTDRGPAHASARAHSGAPLIGLAFEAAREGAVMIRWMHELRQNGIGTPDWVSRLPLFGDAAAAWWQANFADPRRRAPCSAAPESGGIVAFTRALGIQVASRITILVFTLLALFFLYRDAHGVIGKRRRSAIAVRAAGPSPGQGHGRGGARTVNGLVLVGLVEGVLLGIAYLMAGLPHPVLLGLATAVLATVPFGAPLVFAGGALALLVQGHTTAAIAAHRVRLGPGLRR